MNNNNINIAIIGLGQVGAYLYGELLRNRLNINLLIGTELLLEKFYKKNKINEISLFFKSYDLLFKIEKNIEKVKVLKTQSTWFGVTYVEDKAFVESQIKELIQSGEYPISLF